MTLSIGDRIPDIEVKTMGENGPETIRTGDLLGSGRAVLFGVPGAFTPGCSKIHLPGYVKEAGKLRDKGVTTIACTSVNDVWVMEAWSQSQGAGDDIVMLADGNGDLAKALELEWDGSIAGMGLRSQRYAAVIEDGIVTSLEIESKPGVDVSSCENVLKKL